MSEYNVISCSVLSEKQKSDALQLWNEAYPTTLHLKDLEDLDAYLASLGDPKHRLYYISRALIAWFWDFDREGERWFAMMVSKTYRGRGVGSKLLRDALNMNPDLVGWVIDKPGYKHADGGPYRSPLEFYLKHGFQILDQRLELPNLSAVKIARFFT